MTSSRTVEPYQALLTQQILPTFGGVPLKDITSEAIRDWHAELDTTKPTLRSHAYGLLRTILATAVDDEKIPANPCHIRGAGNVKRAKQIQPATLDELEVLVAALPYRYRLMADGVVVIGTPKSDAGIRDVSIPPHLMSLVREHLSQNVIGGRDALLFPAADGVSTLAPATLYRVFYRARDVAGRPDLRWHDLRHTGAVLAAQTGATLAELLSRLGHSSPAAALRYQHAALGRETQIAVALSKIAEGRT